MRVGGDVAATAEWLPDDLLWVPNGRVVMGSTAQALIDLVETTGGRASTRRASLRAFAPELGPRAVDVAPFWLHRFPVTNEQYQRFVEATRHRFPFHWWKLGASAHFQATRATARAEFGDVLPELYYWQAHWRDLPCSIPQHAERQPVTFVSYRDALAFCAWVGMRLPTEAEWILAATGGVQQQYLWGDECDDETLADLGLDGRVASGPRDVDGLGAVARGVFGHEGLVGLVWHWVGSRGFLPVDSVAAFQAEWAEIERRDRGASIGPPEWSRDKRILKGGSFLSKENPAELRIGTRASVMPQQTLEAVGFRVARGVEPARAMSASRIALREEQQGDGRWSFAGVSRCSPSKSVSSATT